MSTKRNWSSVFYWVGVCMTVACVGLVLVGNTKIGFRLEQMDYPLSWIAAGVRSIGISGERSAIPTVPSDSKHEPDVSPKYRGAFEI